MFRFLVMFERRVICSGLAVAQILTLTEFYQVLRGPDWIGSNGKTDWWAGDPSSGPEGVSWWAGDGGW